MSANDVKHTPGPWHQDLDDITNDAGHTVCVVSFGDTDGADWDEAESNCNARLIAAAPDLLAALESAALTMDNAANLLLGDTDENVAIAEYLTACAMSARAAIAKARGEA